MSAVAQRASCSKETLYKWFGDRDGLLTATVRWQASQGAAPATTTATRLDASALQASLEAFAANWLKVISSRTSIALNRVAIGHAGSGKSNLGQIVLANGRFAIGERLKPLLEAAREAGCSTSTTPRRRSAPSSASSARDVQIRLLLGDTLEPDRSREIARDARRATQQFLAPLRARRRPTARPANTSSTKGRKRDMRVYYDRDADINLIKGKKVAIDRLRQPGPRPCAEPARFRRQGRRHRAAQGLGRRQEGRGRQASR